MDDAIRFVLRGSQWRGKDELARLMRTHGDTYNTFEKAFLSRFGDVDFDWPWFDECLQRFSALGRHPDRWDDFFDNGMSDDDDEPFTVRGALARLHKADLLALAKESGVPVLSAEKVDAIRAVLAERLPEHVAARLVQQAESEWAASLAKAQRHRKRILLYLAILGVDHDLRRQRQLMEAGFTYYVFRAWDECPVHQDFDGLILPSGHPFWQAVWLPAYPGDACRILGADGPQSAKLAGGDPSKHLPPDWERRLR
jgi:hypothetical protein